MTAFGHRGYALVTVLIVTAVGLLFGAGSLLLFRFQCQQRIERQHELEKIYAVRSALNWTRAYDSLLPAEGWPLTYYTGSGRSLDLLVKPVEYIFPDVNFVTNGVVRHLVMEGIASQGSGRTTYSAVDKDNNKRILTVSSLECPNQFNEKLDYEYGMMSVLSFGEIETIMPDLSMVGKVDESSITYKLKKGAIGEDKFGICFPNSTTNNVKWWVNVGMPGKGGWLQSEYGRRYSFSIGGLVGMGDSIDGQVVSTDIFHFCLIKDNLHQGYHPGCRRGWPLSANESAFVLRIEKGQQGGAVMELYEYVYGDAPILLANHYSSNFANKMGVQIAGKKVSLFYFHGGAQGAGGAGQIPADIKEGFREMSDKTYLYFRGNDIDAEDRIRSTPDLRAVFEVIASSNIRGLGRESTSEDFVSELRVSPAYQYDVFLKCPNVKYADENGDLATVAQLIPALESGRSVGFPIMTYDTHGTENKGFRKDEREAERKRNRR